MFLPDHPYPDYEPRPDGPFLGENHAYTVTFRGNGEAVVVGRFTFTNTDDKPKQYYRLRVPRVNPDEIAVFQQVRRGGGCLRWNNPIQLQQPLNYISPNSGPEPCFAYTNQTDCEANALNVAPFCYWRPDAADSCRSNPLPTPTPAVFFRKPICLEFEEPDYYNYWSGTSEYKKVNFEKFGDEIEIKLSKPLATNQSASLVLYYRAFGYAKKTFPGRFRYAFETLETNKSIQNLTVAIETDSDLYIKGAKGKTNYRVEEGVAMLRSSPTSIGAEGGGFDSYYQQIGQGTVQKTASNLQAGESYTVTGVYADAVYKLYLKEIVVGIILAIAAVAFLILIVRFVIRLVARTPDSSAKRTKGVAAASSYQSLIHLFMALGVSFVSSLIIFVTFLMLVAFYNIGPHYSFGSYYDDGYGIIPIVLRLIIVLFILLVDLIAFLTPVAFMWKKKGALWGIATLACTILWLIVYLIIVLSFMLIFSQSRTIPYFPGPIPIEPMMGR